MDLSQFENTIVQRVQAMNKRVETYKDLGLYFYNQPIEELRGVGRLEDAFISMIGAPEVDPANLAWLDRDPR